MYSKNYIFRKTKTFRFSYMNEPPYPFSQAYTEEKQNTQQKATMAITMYQSTTARHVTSRSQTGNNMATKIVDRHRHVPTHRIRISNIICGDVLVCKHRT